MKIKPILPYIFFSVTIFVISLFIGYIAAKVQPALVELVFSQLREKFSPLQDAASHHVFAFIFLNNTLIDLVIILSFFLIGLVPFFILFSNGMLIGLVLQSIGNEQSVTQTIALLAPHGILEIPAFLIAAGTGFWLSIRFLKSVLGKESFRESFVLAMKLFFYLILPLNLLAAFIETYITPLIHAWVA